MKALLGVLIAACVLAVSGTATARSAGTTATFYSVGDEPILRYDFTPLPHKKVGGFSVDTISPPGQANIMFQWHRDGLPGLTVYDYMSEMEAWGELSATLFMDINIAGAGAGHPGAGTFSILYNGPDLVANGKTYSAGARLLYGNVIYDDYSIWGPIRSDFITGPRLGLDQMYFDLKNAEMDGYIMTAGLLSGSYHAAVPEPATWAMMIIGLGMVGSGLRYRRFAPLARSI